MADATRTVGCAWLISLSRGALAVVAALVIVLTSTRTAELGLLVFCSWAFLTGAIGLGIVARWDRRRAYWWVIFGTTLVAGVAGWFLVPTMSNVLYLIAVWAAISGFTELFIAARISSGVRERLFVGGLTAVLSIVMLVAPLNPVTSVGCLAVYYAVLGVYLLIDGVSRRGFGRVTLRGAS